MRLTLKNIFLLAVVLIVIFSIWSWKTNFHFYIKPYFVEMPLSNEIELAYKRYEPKTVENGLLWDSRTAPFLRQSKDGNYYSIGSVIIKFDNEGKVLWSREYCKRKDGIDWERYQCRTMGSLVTKDGGLLLYGKQHIKRLGADGSILWEKLYTIQSPSIEYYTEHYRMVPPYSFRYGLEITDGYLLVDTNHRYLVPPGVKYYKWRRRFIKLDFDGNLIWERDLNDVYPRPLKTTNQLGLSQDGNIILRFSYSSASLMVTLDSNGNELNRERFGEKELFCLSDQGRDFDWGYPKWNEQNAKYRSICKKSNDPRLYYLDEFGSRYLANCRRITGLMAAMSPTLCRASISYIEKSREGEKLESAFKLFRKFSFIQRDRVRSVVPGHRKDELFISAPKGLTKLRLVR